MTKVEAINAVMEKARKDIIVILATPDSKIAGLRLSESFTDSLKKAGVTQADIDKALKG